MKYLDIEYKVRDLSLDAISKYEKLLVPYETEYFNKFKEKYPEIDLSNINVVVSDNIWRDIDIFYKGHGHRQDLKRAKGHDHLVKFASVDNAKKIFWSAKYTSDLGIKVFFQVLIENLIGEDLEKKHGINKVFDVKTSVREITNQLFRIWLSHSVSKNESSTIISTDSIQYDNMEELTFAFKKNIKDLHFKYQKELDNYFFITNLIAEFEIFIRRILTYRNQNNLTKGI